MKDRLRKEKSSSETHIAEQVAQAERDVEDRWKSKADRMVAQNDAKWRERLDDVQSELNGLKIKNSELQVKVCCCLQIRMYLRHLNKYVKLVKISPFNTFFRAMK